MSGRTVAYVRVSGKQQTVENQRPALEALAARLGVAVDDWREEQQSAVKLRPVWDGVMADARKGRIGTLAVWALDRVGRSLVDTFITVNELDAAGVRVVSVKEPWLDTRGPTRGLLLAIFSWVAEQERARLIERTRAGLDRARAEGKHLGRPVGRGATGPVPEPGEVARLRAAGASWATIARDLGCTASAARRALARLAETVGSETPSGPVGETAANVGLSQSVGSGKAPEPGQATAAAPGAPA